MTKTWALLYSFYPLVRLVLIAGTTIWVFRLALRLRAAGAVGLRPWLPAALHAALVFLAGALGGALRSGLLALLIVLGSHLPVPILLLRRLAAVRKSGAGAPGAFPPAPGRAASRLPWLIAISGALAPWLIGLGVKLYLDARGRPTHPLGDFLGAETSPVLLLLSLANWSSPLLALAVAASFMLRAEGMALRRNLLMIRFAWIAGIVAAVPVFAHIFWRFDAMTLVLPFGLLLAPPMLLAGGAAWLIRRRSR